MASEQALASAALELESPGASSKWSAMLGWIWEIRDKDLRFHYERHEVGDVILPLVVVRRLDLVLAPTKVKVLAKAATLKGDYDDSVALLEHAAGHSFYNTSKLDFETLVTQDPDNILDNTLDYLRGFSPNVREIVTRFGLQQEVEHMAEAGILLRVLGKFASPKLDLSPAHLSNVEMGSLYEELLRLASDLSNKEAGDHFTPREVISLMVSILVSDTPDLHTPGKVFTVYDPACGTGGMLTEAEHHLLELNAKGRVHLFGEEIALKSHAVCTSDMLIKGQDHSQILRKDTLAKDGFPDRRFDYVLANPPYGVDWTESAEEVVKESGRGFAGRFGAGLPAKTDGQLLFLQHMVAKAKTADEGGGRVAVVLNGSPLFVGDAGQGEPNVRTWLFENDYVEAIIGLPDQLFYNTGIYTYIWVLSTAKRPERQGLVQLIDARDLFEKMTKSLGNKRNELGKRDISEIVLLYESFVQGPRSKIMRNEEFGYTKVIVDRPLRLRYELNDATRSAIHANKALAKLSVAAHSAIIAAVDEEADFSTLDRTEAQARVEVWATKPGKATKATKDALLGAISIPDPAGEVAPGPKGMLKPDVSERDAEYVPLGQDIDGRPGEGQGRLRSPVRQDLLHLLSTQAALGDRRRLARQSEQDSQSSTGGREVIEQKPFKALADIRTSNVDKKTVEGQMRVELCNYTDVYNFDDITSDIEFMPASATPEQIARLSLHKDDVVFTKDSETADDIAVPAYVAEDLPGVVCGYHLSLATPRPGMADGRFLYWALQALPVASQFEVAATGVTRFGLRQSSIKDVIFPAPELADQDRIADFLDGECARIGDLVSEQLQQRALLEERDRLVIKGLTTGVDAPGARVEQGPWWLRSTPASWSPLKIARNFKTGSGTTPKSGEVRFYGGPYPWLTTSECRDAVVSETAKTVTDSALSEYSTLKFHHAGSLVIAMYGATIGKLAILGVPMTVNQACAVLSQPTGLDIQFTYWWLWAHRSELTGMGEGGGQPNINQELIRQLTIPAPSLDEQKAIVTEIESLREVSRLTNEACDHQMDLLAERKQAVITAAVTRQMEVA
jgi:type I restriction enzyme M protein